MAIYNETAGYPRSVARWRLDESSGTTAADAAGVHNGSYVGSPTSSTDVPTVSFGNARSLDLGTSGMNYVTCGTDTGLSLTNQMTVAGWLKSDSFARTGYVFSRRSPTTGNGYALYTKFLTSTTARVTALVSGPTGNVGDTATYVSHMTAGTWHHIAMTYDGSVLRCYLDGVQQFATAGVTSAPFQAVVAIIGNDSTPLSNIQFRGKLDDLRVYGSALAAADIAALAGGSDLSDGVRCGGTAVAYVTRNQSGTGGVLAGAAVPHYILYMVTARGGVGCDGAAVDTYDSAYTPILRGSLSVGPKLQGTVRRVRYHHTREAAPYMP